MDQLSIDRAARAFGATALAAVLIVGAPAAAELRDGANLAAPRPLVLASGALAPVDQAQLAPRRAGDLPIEVRQSIGCLVAGTAGTAVALAGGALNIATGLASGAAAVHGTAALSVGITGVIFAAFCAVGAVMTPLYVYLTMPGQPPQPVRQERHAAGPHVRVALVPADDVRTAAFRSGVLTTAIAQREPAR